MKKLTALLLVLAMLATLTAGCGGSGSNAGSNSTAAATANDAAAASPAVAATDAGAATAAPAPDKPVTLSYWTHQEDPWNVEQDQLIAAFEQQYPNITVEHEAYPYDEFESKTQTSLMSKSGGADVYEMWGGWAIDFAPTGAFAAVPDDFYNQLKSDCYPPVLGALQYDGKLYGVPLEFNAEYGGLLVNKPWFDANNVAYPTTWDDMIKIATDNAKSDNDVFTMRGFDFVSFDSVLYTWLSMILSSGGQYLKDDGSFDFNTPIAKQTLQLLCDYITKNKITSTAGLTGGTDKDNFDWLFMGQSLMAVRGMWCIPTGEENYGVTYGKDFDYIPMPFYGPDKKWAAETGWAMGVNAGSANTDAAWKFIEFIMQPDNLRQMNIACAMIPPTKTVAHDPAYLAAVPYAKPIVDVLDDAQFVGMINTDTMKQAVIDAMVSMITNGTSVDDAVLTINDTCNKK